MAALVFCGCRSGLTPLPTKEARTYQSILEWTRQNGMPGAVLLVQTPKNNFVAATGWADVKRKIPMRTDHEFRIGSITKTFTGITAARLQVEGRLNTDLVITNYLPSSITDHICNSDKITVRQLLRHTSGIYNFVNNPWYGLRSMVFDRRGSWPAMRELKYAYDKPATFAPGEGWEYSNSNFLLLGMIIDRVTGQHHSAAIRSEVLDPLQLTNTYYEGSEPPRGERVHAYEKALGFTSDTYDWTPTIGGNSGLVGTVSDLAKFVRAVAGTNGLMDPAVKKVLKSEMRRGNEENPWDPVYGYDFGVTFHRGAARTVPFTVAPWFFGHDGAVPGHVLFCVARAAQ
jgi:D-alanyl-D-alanine carboxypeptidase